MKFNSQIGLWLSVKIDNIFKVDFCNKCYLCSFIVESLESLWLEYNNLIKANKKSKAIEILSLFLIEIGNTNFVLKGLWNKWAEINFLFLIFNFSNICYSKCCCYFSYKS